MSRVDMDCYVSPISTGEEEIFDFKERLKFFESIPAELKTPKFRNKANEPKIIKESTTKNMVFEKKQESKVTKKEADQLDCMLTEMMQKNDFLFDNMENQHCTQSSNVFIAETKKEPVRNTKNFEIESEIPTLEDLITKRSSNSEVSFKSRVSFIESKINSYTDQPVEKYDSSLKESNSFEKNTSSFFSDSDNIRALKEKCEAPHKSFSFNDFSSEFSSSVKNEGTNSNKLDEIKKMLLKSQEESYKDEERLKEIELILNKKKEDFSNLKKPAPEFESSEKNQFDFEDLVSVEVDSFSSFEMLEMDIQDMQETTLDIPEKITDSSSILNKPEISIKSIDESLEVFQKTEPCKINERSASPIIPSEKLDSFFERFEKIKQCANEERLSDHIKPFKNSRDIIDDFLNFSNRPAFLNCPEIEKKQMIRIHNLYHRFGVPLLSKKHLDEEEVIFRSPGIELEFRPRLKLSSSVVYEGGIFNYIKVEAEEAHWHIRKNLNAFAADSPDHALLKAMTMPDKDYNRFILSDIVQEISLRTSYILFKGKVELVKFIGDSLCICNGDKIKQVIRLADPLVTSDLTFSISEQEFKCSCKEEKDIWVNSIKEKIREKSNHN